MTAPERNRCSSPPSYARFLVATCAITFGFYFVSYMRLPVMPLYARSLGLDASRIGIINSAFFLVAALLSVPLGLASDRLDRRLIALAGLAVLIATSFLMYLSTTMLHMVISYLLLGLGIAAFGPTMMSIVADFSPLTHLGRSYGWLTTAMYTAMSVGPAFGGWLAQSIGYRHVFLAGGILAIIVFMAGILIIPRHATHHVRPAGTAGIAVTLRRLRSNGPLIGCWLTTLGGCFGLGMFVTFFPLHGQERGLVVGQLGMIFFAQGFANALSRIPLGRMSDKARDRRGLVTAGLAGLTASLAGLGFSHSISFFVVFAICLGVSMGLAFTSIGALIVEVVRPQQRGLAMGGYNTSIFVGLLLNAAIMGRVATTAGFQSAFLAAGLVNAVFAVLFLALAKRKGAHAA